MDTKNQQKVFISDGRDEEAKTTVAKFVEDLGLKPITLDNQPSKGQTIIDKFEEQAGEAGFAIILLTPDDVGSSKATGKRKPRAHQNVILELGYFFGSLGNKRVCALYKAGVELLSDVPGLAYVSMDRDNNWQLKIEKKMINAGLPIDMSRVPKKKQRRNYETENTAKVTCA